MPTAAPAPATDPAVERALKLWVVLSRATASIERRAREDVARHDLTLAEFGVLEALYHKGPMLAGQVQRRTLVSSGGITYLVDRLTARGLVERRPCPDDRRANYVALTPSGMTFIGTIFPEHATVIAEVMSALTPAEQETAAHLIRQLGLSLRQAPDPSD
ncbi:MAG TPA: MarR family transcriptional regulator [Gemmatimonadales bacterium]|jgi:MarR family 2-MHQ and catechol resistance regulon transcriptional repressor|nr:MarR family transcriptional regulator [Gemmatimonadales bacterium]